MLCLPCGQATWSAWRGQDRLWGSRETSSLGWGRTRMPGRPEVPVGRKLAGLGSPARTREELEGPGLRLGGGLEGQQPPGALASLSRAEVPFIRVFGKRPAQWRWLLHQVVGRGAGEIQTL